MKKNLFIFLAVISIIACNNKKDTSAFTLKGSVEGYSTANLYLYEVNNEHYNFVKLLDTIPVTDGKFTYTNDTLQTQLYFLSTQGDTYAEKTFTEGAFLFLRAGENQMKVYADAKSQMQIEIKDSPLQARYAEFTKEKKAVSNRQVLDSLDQLFYAARDAHNEKEMIRIKDESMPYYDEAMKKTGEWLTKQIEQEKTTPFGLYLYYTYRFQNESFNSAEETAKVREILNNADDEAKKSVYYAKIEKQLTIIENCAVGHEAPEIVGLDTLDKEVKLSDFRGKYVLVDFWSSGCTWCRKETPNFQKTYNAFKDKNFIILGVSSDFKKEDWMEAIHEDKSYWNQIMMRKEEIRPIMNNYAIVGIPEILLVDPNGIILAKGLRGDDIYSAVVQYVK